MKYLAALTILLFLISSNENLQAQWVQTNGPFGGNIRCFAVSGTNLFAGPDGGVYLSTNNGTSWNAVNSGLPSSSCIYDFTFSGTNIFAGTNDGVYYSANNGTDWTAVNNGLNNSDGRALAVSGTNLLAGTHGSGVWKRPLSEFTSVSNDAKYLPKTLLFPRTIPIPLIRIQ